MNNNHADSNEQNNKTYKQWRVSWLAYMPHIVLFAGSSFLASRDISGLMSLAALVVTAYTVYKMIYLFRMRLYMDDKGVWLFRGVFPWNSGVYGINWSDFEDSVFYMGFFHWMSKSYPVALRTRFSQNPTVYTPSIYRGKTAVEEINAHARTNSKVNIK